MKCYNSIAIFDNDNVKGSIKFHQCTKKEGSIVYIDLHGLKPNIKKAIHIHEYGDERKGCESLGSHWNPYSKTHGTIKVKNMPRHAGDLINNIKPDSSGKFSYTYYDPLVNLRGDVDKSVIGRSIVIHNGVDDLGLGGTNESLKTGSAGSRMACAIISRAKDGKMT
jgi:Cu-Zn family superoxide dismutase